MQEIHLQTEKMSAVLQHIITLNECTERTPCGRFNFVLLRVACLPACHQMKVAKIKGSQKGWQCSQSVMQHVIHN